MGAIVIFIAIITYIAWYLLNPEAELDDRTAWRLAWPAGFGGGLLLGTTGVAAPAIATYVHSLRLARSGFVLGVSVPFLVLGIVQMASLTAFGGYDQERIVAGLMASVPVLVVTPIGMWLGRKISVAAFQFAVLGVLGIAAMWLLWSGIAG